MCRLTASASSLGVADGVVLVGRNEAAGGARAGLDRADGAEVVTLGLVVQKLVLDDLQCTVPDAFRHTTCAMVVDEETLAGAPGHHHDAVAVVVAAVELATGLVVARRFRTRRREVRLPANGSGRHSALRRASVIAGSARLGDRGIDGLDKLAAARKIDRDHGWNLIRCVGTRRHPMIANAGRTRPHPFGELRGAQETADGPAVVLDVDQEGVVALRESSATNSTCAPAASRPLAIVSLLFQRKQDVGNSRR